MTRQDNQALPTRGADHQALAVFLGDWEAEGTSFGGPDQDPEDPRANGAVWTSTHTGRWHTGEFFLIQDERARPGGTVFDTLSVMGVDATTGRYFAQAFENHGFSRRYEVERHGDTWRINGPFERATITFADDGRRQEITWEWRRNDVWFPLCDREAIRNG